VCNGDASGSISILSVTGGTPDYMYAINGNPPQASGVFEGLGSGLYTILVTDALGCSYTESFTVPEGLLLSIDIGPDIELELGDSIVLGASISLPWSQIDSIVWTPAEILSCTHCPSPLLYGLYNSVITATVYSGTCEADDAIVLRVDIDANIYIPNIFSPNGDGINDLVTVFGDHRVRRVVYFEIFDRWGNKVYVDENFLPNDPQRGWDGSFRDKEMNPAVFVYTAQAELINGQFVTRRGDITLIR
jgi:gliding motility-associated-like protein